ncbi:MAG: 16S rRNA (uracil(1498)-N(3))-methyltransferase [Flavobacterium sp.]|nr:MAG: 16S rRNA (uracil(1498)-N(3))-methyltransferase [Flavobacterium sp.]
MQLFFHPDADSTDQSFHFDREESKHIVKVLRKSNGDELMVTNGRGQLFTATITSASENKCVVKIVDVKNEADRRSGLHLAVAPTKMNDRYEWFLEKATEIGISEITPIICERSERKVIKTERFEKILQSAMKQSLQLFLPKLNPGVSFGEFIATQPTGIRLIAHCVEGNRKSLKQVLVPDSDVVMLIGPEGDFTPREIDLALNAGFAPVTLGDTRLRTETAAIVACHSVVFTNEKQQ